MCISLRNAAHQLQRGKHKKKKGAGPAGNAAKGGACAPSRRDARVAVPRGPDGGAA